jgi:putative membrane protein
MMGQYWNEFGAFGMGLGWLFMIVFWALILLGGLALLSSIVGNAGAAPKSAIEILQERYARGEIGREEYEQKSRDVSSRL